MKDIHIIDYRSLVIELRNADWIAEAKKEYLKKPNHGAWAYVSTTKRKAIAFELMLNRLKNC